MNETKNINERCFRGFQNCALNIKQIMAVNDEINNTQFSLIIYNVSHK